MKPLFLVLYGALIGSLGCGRYDHIDIDHKYTPQELEIIEDSIEAWANATGSSYALLYYRENAVIGDDIFGDGDYTKNFGVATMQRVSRNDPGFSTLVDEFGPRVTGVGREGSLVITVTESFYRVDNSLKVEWFHTVVLHELGHFFGLMHGDGLLMKTGIINPCIDQKSLDNFCKMHGDCLDPEPTCGTEENAEEIQEETDYCDNNDCD